MTNERLSDERLADFAKNGNHRDVRAMAREVLGLRPYRDELLKLAADLGEPDDPFAAREALQALRSPSQGEVGGAEAVALVNALVETVSWQAQAQTNGYAAGDPAIKRDEEDVQKAKADLLAALSALEPQEAEPVAWAREVDINGPCLIDPVFLSKAGVSLFKYGNAGANKHAKFVPLYLHPAPKVGDISDEMDTICVSKSDLELLLNRPAYGWPQAKERLTAALTAAFKGGE